MNIKFVNFFKSTIANVGGIAAGDLEFDLAAGDGAKCPTIAAGEYFYLTLVDTSANREIVKVTDVTSDTCTIVRAQDGTTARAFAQNDYVGLRMVNASLEDIISAIDALTGALEAPSGLVMYFYDDTAPDNWTYLDSVTDKLLGVKGGTAAFNVAGGTAAGTWTQPNHTHTGPSHTHTGPSHTHSVGSHTHSVSAHTHGLPIGFGTSTTRGYKAQYSGTLAADWTVSGFGAGGATVSKYVSDSGGGGNTGASTGNTGAGGTGVTGASGTGATGASATATTYRPYTAVGILATKD